MLANIAFNIEYIEGTFITHLLSGNSRRKWMINRLINFYLFVVLQLFISFVVITIGFGIITGSFGLGLLEINKENMEFLKLITPTILNILKTLSFISFAVFIITFFLEK